MRVIYRAPAEANFDNATSTLTIVPAFVRGSHMQDVGRVEVRGESGRSRHYRLSVSAMTGKLALAEEVEDPAPFDKLSTNDKVPNRE